MSLFDSRYKLRLHLIELVFIVVVVGLSVPRLFMKDQPRTRANTIALGMGAKSVIFILYQILTEHVNSFRKWANLKANLILNSLEIVFWAAVVFLLIQANIQICVGVGCILSWIVVGLAVVLVVFSLYAAAISYIAFRNHRKVASEELSQFQSTRSNQRSDQSSLPSLKA